MSRREFQEITVQPAGKDFPVGYLGFMAFAGFEFNLAFEVDVPPGQKAEFDVLVHGSDGEAEFGMINEDLVGRLASHDEWRDYFVDPMELSAGKMDALSGGTECFPVFTIRKKGVIAVLMRDRTACVAFVAAVTDIRSPVDPATVLFDKTFTVQVAGRAGSAFDVTEDYLFAYIGPVAAITLGAEVMSIVKESFASVVFRQSVFPDFFRDGRRIFAQIAGNIFERDSGI